MSEGKRARSSRCRSVCPALSSRMPRSCSSRQRDNSFATPALRLGSITPHHVGITVSLSPAPALLMKLRLLTLAALTFVLAARAENEVGFIERFALAADREKVLTELVPGTEDYYFYHSLHYQNSKQAAKLTAILDQ